MIKANEVRIGNLFNTKKGASPVNSIWNKHSSYNEDSFQLECGTTSHDLNFEPIPLTEEWLVKFGVDIREHSKGKYWHKKSICFEIGNDCIYFDHKNYPTKILSVHHLQNVYFVLTGEELTLKP